jgi:hypothetical protein
METFLLIMVYSVLVLTGLTIFGGALVAVATWLIENTGERHAH